MKNGSLSIVLSVAAAIVPAIGFSADAEGDQFSLKVEDGDPEGKVVTVFPQNEEFKKDPSGGPYIVTVRVASSLSLLRKGLYLKSKRAEIPLDTDTPPPVPLRVFVSDFDFIVVEVSSIKHWEEWKKPYYFLVDDSKLTPVSAEKLGLPKAKSRAEQGAAAKP